MNLPNNISNMIGEETYLVDQTGLSDSSVFLFHDKVLKIQQCNEEAENEYQMMLWLQGKLNVPKIIGYEIEGDKSYLLMDKCEGLMACDETYMTNPQLQAKLLAKGLHNLWNVSIENCPSDCSLNIKLALAKYNVEHDLVDVDNVEPDTFGENGFKDPQELLEWLYENRPEEEFVLSHGDYCLPNVFIQDGDKISYIDLGKTGIADKWCDIALCYRSISNNYHGRYHNKSYSGMDDNLLFKELGIEPDWKKIKYYILLDELF